ncbi:MAG: hypothetical protein J0H43_11640, partial [Actinobacteria bacterium]|nr:hypothetical protein [Actinomycetota bacterium]
RRQAVRARHADTMPSGRSRHRGRLARLLLRTPAKGYLHARQWRYIQKLTAKFERHEWQDALSTAIALGPSGPAWLRLRLPKPRTSLSLETTGASSALPVDLVAQVHLRRLYVQAAEELEERQRISEAVFVRAVLLGDTAAAVDLLERNGQVRTAAELAEARRMPAAMIVRLWWRAGDRERAVAVARSRGAFATALTRLAEVDPAGALELRREWVRDRQEAGDRVGAVEAAWSEPALRPLIEVDLEAGTTPEAGPIAGHLLPYRLAMDPSPPLVERVEALLKDQSDATRRTRDRLLLALADVPIKDGLVDRRVATAAVLRLVQEPRTTASSRLLHQLGRRADPLVRADLPTPPPTVHGATIEVTAPEEAGDVPLTDAVALSTRDILVAYGGAGVQLLTADGRVRARWDVPAHQLVVADSGATALLVRLAGQLSDV